LRSYRSPDSFLPIRLSWLGPLGEAIDIYVNNRLIARGEVVMVDNTRLGVTMTEIVKSDR
jgi:flagellar motor switch/type III secretory pathway protein FliN